MGPRVAAWRRGMKVVRCGKPASGVAGRCCWENRSRAGVGFCSSVLAAWSWSHHNCNSSGEASQRTSGIAVNGGGAMLLAALGSQKGAYAAAGRNIATVTANAESTRRFRIQRGYMVNRESHGAIDRDVVLSCRERRKSTHALPQGNPVEPWMTRRAVCWDMGESLVCLARIATWSIS
jgi:hypothetical protein